MTRFDYFLDGASVLIVFLAMVFGGGFVVAALAAIFLGIGWSVLSGQHITDFSVLFQVCYALTLLTIGYFVVKDWRNYKKLQDSASAA